MMNQAKNQSVSPAVDSGTFRIRQLTTAEKVRLAQLLIQETDDRIAKWMLMDVIKSLLAGNQPAVIHHAQTLARRIDGYKSPIEANFRMLIDIVTRESF